MQRIKGFNINEGYEYLATKDGKIFCNGKELAQFLNVKKYPNVALARDGKKRVPTCVHRIMALTYISDSYRNENLQVNHIDGNKQNNNLENLELITNKQNCIHRINVIEKKSYCLSELLDKYGHPSISYNRAMARISRHGWKIGRAHV